MEISKLLEQLRDNAKQDYLRVLDLHESKKVSREQLFDKQGFYCAMEQAYHAVQTQELSNKIERSVELNTFSVLRNLVKASSVFLEKEMVGGTSAVVHAQDELATAIEYAEVILKRMKVE